MKKKLLFALALALPTMHAMPLSADSLNGGIDKYNKRFYGVGFIDYNIPSSVKTNFNRTGKDTLTGLTAGNFKQTISADSSVGGGLGIGVNWTLGDKYSPNYSTQLEWGYNNFDFKSTRDSDDGKDHSLTDSRYTRHKIMFTNILRPVPLTVQPIVILGVGASFWSSQIAYNDERANIAKGSGVSPILSAGFGFEYNILKNLSADIHYRFEYDGGSKKLSNSYTSTKGTVHNNVQLKSITDHALVLNVKYDF